MLDNLPTLAETLKIHHLYANKKLGQHFLLDMNITDKIAKLTGPLEGVNVAEVGPGPGGLTRSLVTAGAKHVLAIEMDDRFLVPLSDITDAADGKLTVLGADALTVDIPKHINGEIRIAANLPYNVGTKLLINWLTASPLFWTRAVLMFQKEVAERVVAKPSDSAYGRLAILSQSVCEADLAFVVPSKAFSPPPKVDSAVVVLNPLPEAQRFEDLVTLGKVTASAFQMRRKMLRRSLKGMASAYGWEAEAWLEACEIDPQRRPETLSVLEFHELTRAYIIHLKNRAP